MPVDAPRSTTQTDRHLGTIGQKFAELVEKVGGLADPQCAHALLRACLGPGKVLYALRTCDVFAGTGNFVAQVGAAHRRAFEGVVGDAISEAAWLQAGLPLRLGGCGIGGVEELAPVARLAAILQFERGMGPILGMSGEGLGDGLMRCPDLLRRLGAVLPADLDPLVRWTRTGCVIAEPGPTSRQKWWGDNLAASQAERLRRGAMGLDIVRLEAQRAGTGQWMSAPPVGQAGLCPIEVALRGALDPGRVRGGTVCELQVPSGCVWRPFSDV